MLDDKVIFKRIAKCGKAWLIVQVYMWKNAMKAGLFKLECRGMRESIPLVGNCLSLHLCIFRSVIIVSLC